MDNSVPANCSRNLAKVEQNLRGRGAFYFAKKLFASNVGQFSQQRNIIDGPCQLSLPRSFVRAHGDKFRKSVVLRSRNKMWSVRIAICPSRKPPEVTFCAGWRSFVYDNGLAINDNLIFHLRATSKFEVYIFNCHGEPKALRALGLRVNETEISQQQVNTSVHGEPEAVTALGLRVNETEISQQQVNDSVRETKREKLTTVEIDNLTYESTYGRSMTRAEDSEKKLAVLPATFKTKFRYRPRGCILEIPARFAKKYGKWLKRRLLVQGIFDYSRLRIMSAAHFKINGKVRLCLDDGLDEFWRNNMLQDGQELIFTLVSDSKFNVRAVSSS